MSDRVVAHIVMTVPQIGRFAPTVIRWLSSLARCSDEGEPITAVA